jgi:nucleoside-diphosphate-sugar epimerase
MVATTIIGAGGFVGTRLVESLVLGGETDVRAVVRAYRSFAGLSRFGPAVTVRVADAESPASLAPALRGSSVAINLTTGPPASIIRTTKAIVEACAAAKVGRLIHLSSAVVYGEVTSPSIDDDSPPLRRHWMPYARAKAASEIWLRGRASAAGCQVAVLRPGIVWGVRSPHTAAAAGAILAKTAYLVGGGKGIFNSIYIDNLIDCIRACRGHRGDATGFYNVADREVVTWRDFYAALAAPLGCDVGRLPDVPAGRFPWSARALLDYVMSLPPACGLYHRLKSRLPDAVKAALKASLAGRYNYEGAASGYATKPTVERELWSLQRVRYKLPTAKFARRFGYTPAVTFEEGVRRTLGWLTFLGRTPSRDLSPGDRAPR